MKSCSFLKPALGGGRIDSVERRSGSFVTERQKALTPEREIQAKSTTGTSAKTHLQLGGKKITERASFYRVVKWWQSLRVALTNSGRHQTTGK